MCIVLGWATTGAAGANGRVGGAEDPEKVGLREDTHKLADESIFLAGVGDELEAGPGGGAK